MRQPVPSSTQEILAPGRSALLLWDMHDGVATRAHNREELFPVVQSLLDAARAADIPVIWARHVPTKREFMPASKSRPSRLFAGTEHEAREPQVPSPERPHFVQGFEPLETEWVIDKPTQSFFIGTDLEIGLRGLGVDSLVLAGVATEMGVEFTARHAGALGFYIAVVEDGVGSFTASGHEIGMAYLRSPSALYIDLLPSSRVVAAWSR
jgi:nicotinamidase-related amidase